MYKQKELKTSLYRLSIVKLIWKFKIVKHFMKFVGIFKLHSYTQTNSEISFVLLTKFIQYFLVLQNR